MVEAVQIFRHRMFGGTSMRILPQFAVPRRSYRAIGLGAFLTATAVIAACSADSAGSALSPSSLARAGSDSSKPPRDTTKPPRDTTKPPPRDTIPRDTVDTLPPRPEKVNVSGRVLGVVVITPTPGARDTLRFDPLPGVNVRIMRNVLVDGVAKQVLAAQLVSDAQGRFAVKELAGGYYVVYAEPPAGSIWGNSFSYLNANRAEVTVDVYLWRRPNP
jgi:hypothetical protein